jgi:hypothetical protein
MLCDFLNVVQRPRIVVIFVSVMTLRLGGRRIE